MKKYILTSVLVLAVSLLVVTSASAQTTFFQRLQALFGWGEQTPPREQQAAVSPATSGAVSSSPSPASSGGGGTPAASAPGFSDCPGGATMPSGVVGQTLRCDGTRWVADSNLVNDGLYIGIGATTSPLVRKLFVFTTQDYTAIDGSNASNDGIGVHGSAKHIGVLGKTASGTGVLGQTNSGKAVFAVQNPRDGTGYGFYQEGPNAKNYFEGKVGIGTRSPVERLDLGGGNIKMGYEKVIATSTSSRPFLNVFCPAGKQVISGGCSWSAATGTPPVALLGSFGPRGANDGWFCEWNQVVGQPIFHATAICANIR